MSMSQPTSSALHFHILTSFCGATARQHSNPLARSVFTHTKLCRLTNVSKSVSKPYLYSTFPRLETTKRFIIKTRKKIIEDSFSYNHTAKN